MCQAVLVYLHYSVLFVWRDQNPQTPPVLQQKQQKLRHTNSIQLNWLRWWLTVVNSAVNSAHELINCAWFFQPRRLQLHSHRSAGLPGSKKCMDSAHTGGLTTKVYLQNKLSCFLFEGELSNFPGTPLTEVPVDVWKLN